MLYSRRQPCLVIIQGNHSNQLLRLSLHDGETGWSVSSCIDNIAILQLILLHYVDEVLIAGG